MEIETIPLPRDDIRNGESFELDVSNIVAWPRQRLRLRFDYNTYTGRWIYEVEHRAEERTLFPRSVVTLGWEYSAWPYAILRFIDVSGGARRADRDTLGDEVRLAIYPGPAGGRFLPEADIDPYEEHELLNREEYGYPNPEDEQVIYGG